MRPARIALAVVAVAGGLIATAEFGTRVLGLHRPVLYEATAYGYRVVPDQDLRRFGNHVFYNHFGMRSEPATPRPAADVLRILCVGDSVTNGGTSTDQAETYPYLLQRELAGKLGRGVEVLNASAGGWALENAEGWLRANGIFGSRVVVLEVGTHDLFQRRAESDVVGRHPSFPAHPPFSGLTELWYRYVLPRLESVAPDTDPGVMLEQRSPSDVERELATIDRIDALVRADGGSLVVLHVPQPANLEPGDTTTRDAKRALAAHLDAHHIPLVVSADALARAGGVAAFRDGMHPNPRGNKALAEVLAPAVIALVRR